MVTFLLKKMYIENYVKAKCNEIKINNLTKYF